jgi:hypothetical protein
VRNVKKGAEPINGLRDKLRDIIFKTVVTVQSCWNEQDAAQQRERGVHGEAEDIAAKTKDISPKPVAGQDTTEPEREQKIRVVAEAITKNEPEKAAEVAKEISERPMTIVPQNIAGNELFEIEHLGSTALVKLNMRHPFYREVYANCLWKLNAPLGCPPEEHDPGMEKVLINLVLHNPHNDRWVKRDTDTGRFMDQKADPRPFKGVRKEK